MNFILKKTFCYEPIAEALSVLSKNVIVWDENSQFSLKEIIKNYDELCFIGIYEQCKPSTLRMLKSYNIKSLLISDKQYTIDDQNCTIINLFNRSDINKDFYKKQNIKYLESFWPFCAINDVPPWAPKIDPLYASDLAFIYDCDYSKIMKKLVLILENSSIGKITTWGNSETWPWMRHNGMINEYNMPKIIRSSKYIGMPENADKRHIIKTLCHGGTPILFDDDFKEIQVDKSQYEYYDSILFLKEMGNYLC